MPTHTEVRRLARQFKKAYPPTLPERLVWWKQVLGIDRERFLRLLGLTPEEIVEDRARSLESIVEQNQEQGWMLEGRLAALVSLYSYDWTKLADDLHNSAQWTSREDDRMRHFAQSFRDQPGTMPSDEILLDRVINGGPDAWLSLRDYLARSVETQEPV